MSCIDLSRDIREAGTDIEREIILEQAEAEVVSFASVYGYNLSAGINSRVLQCKVANLPVIYIYMLRLFMLPRVAL